MAFGIFPHTWDVKGQLTTSTTASSDNEIANKKYVDDNSGGGGGGPTYSTKSADLTLAQIHTAYQAASAKPWYVTDTGFTLSSGDTVIGFHWELKNTLYKYNSSWGSAPGSAYYDKVLITVDNPDDSTTNPIILSGAAIGQSTWNEGGPYAPSPTGGVYPGFLRQDSSYNNVPVVNYGTTTTDKDYLVFPSHYVASSTVNVRFAFFESTGTSTTVWTINDGSTYPTNDSTIIGTLTMYYRS